MPTKHIVKKYGAPAFYHVYNRASGERALFRDSVDREYFLTLLQKHLAETDQPEKTIVKKYNVEIVAYCLMGTHFHLLLYQDTDPEAMPGYMRSVSTAYSMYYNKKYKSKGHVFQSSYRASYINQESYLAHITRYIHLNPRRYKTWRWSSYGEYVGRRDDDWVHPERVGDVTPAQYEEFVASYVTVDRRKQYTEISSYLAF